MASRHSLSKWVRIVVASLLTAVGAWGVLLAWNAGNAQERYFRFKYGHLIGTKYEVPPVNFEKDDVDPVLLEEIVSAVYRADSQYPENHYFPCFAAHQCLLAALNTDDPVEFRRRFSDAEHWCRIARIRDPYDIEACYIHCRILWEKGDREGAIAFWRDEVVAREFWNPDLRYHLVDLCRRSGNNSLALREARFLKGSDGAKAMRDLTRIQRTREAWRTKP